MTNKEIKQFREIKEKMFDCEHITSEELKLFHELELKRNKQYVYFRLSGRNKYYHGNICYEFRNIILWNGIQNIKQYQIKDVRFGENYTITIKYITADLKQAQFILNSFDTKSDLIGYVKGFIACYRNYNKNYYKLSNQLLNEDLEKKTNKKDITL